MWIIRGPCQNDWIEIYRRLSRRSLSGIAVPNFPEVLRWRAELWGFPLGSVWHTLRTKLGLDFRHKRLFLKNLTPYPKNLFLKKAYTLEPLILSLRNQRLYPREIQWERNRRSGLRTYRHQPVEEEMSQRSVLSGAHRRATSEHEQDKERWSALDFRKGKRLYPIIPSALNPKIKTIPKGTSPGFSRKSFGTGSDEWQDQSKRRLGYCLSPGKNN